MVVTGCAGFIGSSLSRELLHQGHHLLGIDCLTDYYDVRLKRWNLAELVTHPHFELAETDLVTADLRTLVDDADVVFHLAGQPGVRGSWADGFRPYAELNVLATQRILEAAKDRGVQRVVYASSSSVYGNADHYPCHEDDLPRPHSPYGVTKLAGEHLARLYARNHGLPTVSLRYFTVFGPRQRPEMAMAQIIEAGLSGEPFDLFAAPGTLRDFTYIDDVVAATSAAGTTPGLAPGAVYNVAGGAPATMEEVLGIVAGLMGSTVPLRRAPVAAGDVIRTGGDSTSARQHLGWRPVVTLAEGLARQVDWQRAAHLPLLTQQPHHQPVIDLREVPSTSPTSGVSR